MFLYAIAGIGVNMLNLMMGSYLCSALVADGFGAEAVMNQTFAGANLVIPVAWGVFGLVAKIIDGVIDIPMASFSDNLKSRFGRRRPTLVIGLVVMIAAYLLFLVIPTGGENMLNTIYYGIVLCVFYSFYTLTMVTYYATFTEIVETEAERTLISNVKSVCDIFYFIIGYVLVPMFLKGMNIRTVALIVLPLVLSMTIPLFMIKEKSTLDTETEKTESVNLFKSIAYTFKNKPFILWMIVYAFMNFGVQLFLSGINEYFSVAGLQMMYVMMASFAPVPFTFFICNWIKRKWGFGASFRYTLICFAVGMLVMFYAGTMPADSYKGVVGIIAGVISSFSIGSMFSVAYSVPSQLAAEEAERTGVSNGAMYFAVQGLFSGVATGLGGSLVLNILKEYNIVIYMTPVCAAGVLIAFALTWALPKSIIGMGKGKKK